MESTNHADAVYSRPNRETAKGRKVAGEWEHTRSSAASYTFGGDESGNLGIAIMVRHDLPLPAG